jgi:glyoxylate reductase
VKVLATRHFPGPAWEELGDVELLSAGGLTAPRPGIEALVLANETVDAALLDLLPDLRLIANYGVGYDRIDVAECERRGIAVTNTPGVLDAATADLALALMLAARRRVVEGDRTVRRGDWAWGWSEGFLGDEVTGATLGIVGLGRIGEAVARRARGFELRLLYTKRRRLDPGRERELGVEYRDLDALLREADVVTLHVPRSPETEGIVDARRLALLRDGACLVNTARGELVDEPALVRELVSGRIRAGLDVFAREPHVPPELLDLPNVVLTPHLGSATTRTREAMTRLVVDNVLAAEAGRPLPTPVLPVEPS